MELGSSVTLAAPPPIISVLTNQEKWALKKTISGNILHLLIDLLRFIFICFYRHLLPLCGHVVNI